MHGWACPSSACSAGKACVCFRANDMLDQTPVPDIKPFVPEFDHRETSRTGWYAGRIENLQHTRSDDRMGR